ncbi:MAG: cation transporter [Flavobacteriales bacterium]
MKYFLTIVVALFGVSAFAQRTTSTTDNGKYESVAIQSSALCDVCKKAIEGELFYVKGVKKVDVDVATDVVHVTYDPDKNEPVKLRKALMSMGYSADGKAGDAAANARLPKCCRKEGCGKLPEKQ